MAPTPAALHTSCASAALALLPKSNCRFLTTESKSNPGYRIDLLVNDEVIVEVKSVIEFHPVHQAQLLSYLKLSKRRVGLLINFNVVHLKDGIVRLVN